MTGPLETSALIRARAEEAAWAAEFAWSLKMETVEPGSSPVADSLALAASLQAMNLRTIAWLQEGLLRELARKRLRTSRLDALLRGADLVQRTEEVLQKACGTHLKIAIELERRLEARGCATMAPAGPGPRVRT